MRQLFISPLLTRRTEFFGRTAYAACLFGTAGRVRLRVEIQEQLFALEVGQRDSLAVLINQGKIGRLTARFQFCHSRLSLRSMSVFHLKSVG